MKRDFDGGNHYGSTIGKALSSTGSLMLPGDTCFKSTNRKLNFLIV